MLPQIAIHQSLRVQALAVVMLVFGGLGLPSISLAQEDPIAAFIKMLFKADKVVGAAKSADRPAARQAGDQGADLYYGKAALDRLASTVNDFEAIVRRGGWGRIPDGPPMRTGNEDKRVPAIRKHLLITGDLTTGKAATGDEFDPALHDAVVRFQTRHGLPNAGYLGKQTIAALNVKAETRLGQLRRNLERMTRLATLGASGRAIVVNIPAYELQAIESGRVAFSSRVIVGRKDRKTPTISAKIIAVNLLPAWRVPASIAARDLIPKLQSDPDYFSRENFRIVRAMDGRALEPRDVDWSTVTASQIRFEQSPGVNNALGLIRIDMPNAHTVYLHDTPLKKLFQTTARPFSSGCVRVQKIAEVATWLIAKQANWDVSKLAETIQSGKPQTVKLVEAVPVHFIYLTAWVEPDGDVHFREDVYRLDEATSAAESYISRTVPAQPVTP